jgi:hypothetical protein
MNSIASNAVLQGLETMITAAVTDAVRKLVDAGLISDADAAMRVLGEVVVRQEPIPIAALPWCGMVQEDKCIGITRGRHRLFTQCQGSRSHGEYCKKCKGIFDKTGTLPCGTTHTRLAADPMDYMNVQPFLVVMEQNNWTPEYVRFSVAHHGGTLDERNFSKAPKKTRRGRPTTTTPMAGPPLPLRPVDEEPEPEVPEAPPEAPPVRAAESESEDESEPAAEPPTAEQINKMTKVQLAEVCATYNISTQGADGKPKKVAEIKSVLLERFAS